MSRTAILTSGANLSIAMHRYRETIAADIFKHLKFLWKADLIMIILVVNQIFFPFKNKFVGDVGRWGDFIVYIYHSLSTMLVPDYFLLSGLFWGGKNVSLSSSQKYVTLSIIYHQVVCKFYFWAEKCLTKFY